MPEPTTIEKLDAVRMLLREGRVTEADVAIDTLEKGIRDEEARRILETPPPGPLSRAELIMKFYETVADILGNPPRLLALIVEIKGKSDDDDE